MKLIDTSCWIEALRKEGNPGIRNAVLELLIHDEAAWCPFIELELWNGVSKPKERKFLEELSLIPSLEINQAVWRCAFELVQLCRQRGNPVPNTDAIIAACSRVHQVELLHNDRHFDYLLNP